MAAELITPCDELTGLPLPVLSPLELLEQEDRNQFSWHHVYHPSNSPQLRSLGGNALKNSRLQLLPNTQHNLGYERYHLFYGGPKLPDVDDAKAQLARTVFGVAEFIPDEGIDLNGGNPYKRHISTDEVRALRARHFNGDPRFIRHVHEPVQKFFVDHLMQVEMLDVRPELVGNFLRVHDELARANIGRILLTRMALVATSDIATTYGRLHKAEKLGQNAPPRPEDLVLGKLGPSSKLLPRLRQVARQKLDQQG